MASLLYLDTARLGQMSPGAQHAQTEFNSLADDSGCCMYFEAFLRDGATAQTDHLPHLRSWHGLCGLRQRLKRFARAAPDSRVLLAQRSSQLMTLAAYLLAERCHNVLLTDLTWPSYARMLRTVASRTGCRTTCLPLHQRIFADQLTAADISQLVLQAYESHGCDGLFLPLVDNLGVHFPVGQCVRAVQDSSAPAFVTVDGAQTLGHVPLHLAELPCDFFLAGCHKWLRAHQPLGLAFFGNNASRNKIDTTTERLLASGQLDDPLLDFTEQLRTGRRSAFGETVNLSPLLTCHGALLDAERRPQAVGRVDI